MSNLVEVKIPTNANPFNVTVNGKKYSYPAGATVQVPPEVAEVIEQIGRGPSLPPSSGGGSSGGSGADLLNEKGVIKQQHLPENFPYKEGEESVILPETTVEIIDSSASLPNLINLRVGQKYTVIWNGVEYKCEGQDYVGMGCAVGNFREMTEVDTGEPFFITAVYPESFDEVGIGVSILALSKIPDGTQVTLSISGKTETITKIGMEYLPDGYPYSKISEGYILPETSYAVDDSAEMTFIMGAPLALVIGQEYTVNWNGTEYTCTAIDSSAVGEVGGYVLGNIGTMTGGEDTGEPFVLIIPGADIEVTQSGVAAAVIPLDGTSEGTVAIFGMTEVVTPIAKKYLTNVVEPFIVVFEFENINSSALSASKSYYECLAAIKNHKPIYCYAAIPGVDILYAFYVSQAELGDILFCRPPQIVMDNGIQFDTIKYSSAGASWVQNIVP